VKGGLLESGEGIGCRPPTRKLYRIARRTSASLPLYFGPPSVENNVRSGDPKTVFCDGVTTALAPNGAILQQVTPDDEIRVAIAQRQGETECRLQMGEETVATGGILFRCNERVR
jgi:hypothetical protein